MGRPGFDPWVRKILWRREQLAALVFFLAWGIPWAEELAGYSPRVQKELDMTEQLSHTHTHTHYLCNKITHVKTFYILVNNIMERSVSKETSESAD